MAKMSWRFLAACKNRSSNLCICGGTPCWPLWIHKSLRCWTQSAHELNMWCSSMTFWYWQLNSTVWILHVKQIIIAWRAESHHSFQWNITGMEQAWPSSHCLRTVEGSDLSKTISNRHTFSSTSDTQAVTDCLCSLQSTWFLLALLALLTICWVKPPKLKTTHWMCVLFWFCFETCRSFVLICIWTADRSKPACCEVLSSNSCCLTLLLWDLVPRRTRLVSAFWSSTTTPSVPRSSWKAKWVEVRPTSHRSPDTHCDFT